MKTYHIVFCTLCLLYITIVALSYLVPVKPLFISICGILLWSMLAVVASKQMLITPKPNRRFKHYFFVFVSLLLLALTIFRIITR